jgi:hypothetical protein
MAARASPAALSLTADAADAAAAQGPPREAPRALCLLDLPDELLVKILTRRARARRRALSVRAVSPSTALMSTRAAPPLPAFLSLRDTRLSDTPFPAAALPGYTGVDPRPDGARAPARTRAQLCARTRTRMMPT